MNKTALIAASLAAALSTSSAFAWWGDDDSKTSSHHSGCSGEFRMGHGQGGHHGRHGMKGPKMIERMNRSYTAQEIRTLSEARLIQRGNPNIKVGEVIPTSNGYKVTIVTKDNSLVEERELAKNGMPLDRYNMMKKKIDNWEKRQNG